MPIHYKPGSKPTEYDNLGKRLPNSNRKHPAYIPGALENASWIMVKEITRFNNKIRKGQGLTIEESQQMISYVKTLATYKLEIAEAIRDILGTGGMDQMSDEELDAIIDAPDEDEEDDA